MIKARLKEIILQAINKAFPNIQMPDFSVEYADEKFGDYSTNVAMILAGKVGEKPAEIAEKIIKRIRESENQIIETAKVAGPGFINFKIALPFLNQKILEVTEAGEEYGKIDLGENRQLNLEFISANPTGPLTIGNARGGVIGDVLGNILAKAGWQVTREYYFNDKGGQIDILGHSVLKDTEAQYKGDYIDRLHDEIKGDSAREVGEKAAEIIISQIKKTTEKMGIKFDVWFAEGKELRDKGKVEEIIAFLKEKDLAYEKEGALWFCSTKFGDDKDRVLLKSDGEPTYFCLDAAYHKNKFVERKFDFCLNIWGADHFGDLRRVEGFVEALGYKEKFRILIHQFVRLMQEGKEVRMSKRTGNFIAVDDLLKEVGKDVYRFFMLEYDLNTHIDFDLALAKEQSQKNPVFYVQYAFARIHGILAKIKNDKSKCKMTNQNAKLLKEPAELALIKELIKFPDLVKEIAQDYQVQKLPAYALKLAKSFHNFYEKCPILKAEDKQILAARLELLMATKIVLKNSLDLMGVSAPERM